MRELGPRRFFWHDGYHLLFSFWVTCLCAKLAFPLVYLGKGCYCVGDVVFLWQRDNKETPSPRFELGQGLEFDKKSSLRCITLLLFFTLSTIKELTFLFQTNLMRGNLSYTREMCNNRIMELKDSIEFDLIQALPCLYIKHTPLLLIYNLCKDANSSEPVEQKHWTRPHQSAATYMQIYSTKDPYLHAY